MNLITDFFIETEMSDYYADLCNQYGENRILGVFVTGLANYGFAETADDLILNAVYLPTFDELCTGITKFVDINILDIREVYHIAEKHEWRSLEMLCSKYTKVNPKYVSIFNQFFIDNRNLIAHYHDLGRLNKALIRADQARADGNTFEIARLHVAATEFVHGATICQCFHPTGVYEQYLSAVKKGTIKINEEEIFEDFYHYCENADDSYNEQADEIIKQGTIALVSAAITESVSFDAFESTLTKTEKLAWDFLRNKLTGGAGVISISKIIEETNISRPVWTNLLQKISQNRVGSVTACGAKGTVIKLFGQI